MTDDDENVVESYEYTAYGQTAIKDIGGSTVSASPIGNPFMYTARRLDEETGLYYYRARHYSPVLRRFVQRDPLEYRDGPNSFTYVTGAPTSGSDPSGLEEKNPLSKLSDKELNDKLSEIDNTIEDILDVVEEFDLATEFDDQVGAAVVGGDSNWARFLASWLTATSGVKTTISDVEEMAVRRKANERVQVVAEVAAAVRQAATKVLTGGSKRLRKPAEDLIEALEDRSDEDRLRILLSRFKKGLQDRWLIEQEQRRRREEEERRRRRPSGGTRTGGSHTR